ncbi:hypothetical protein [Nocardia africana]|uniref:DUF222 domain-containing protein n=1 Tax=Nocardia africana TaxID=134964 RepID=A0ABW6NRJ5_9NOCA
MSSMNDPVGRYPKFHDCDEDPGPIYSYFAAMAFATASSECDPEHCRTRARVEEALSGMCSAAILPPRTCVAGLEQEISQRVYAKLKSDAAQATTSLFAQCRIDPGVVGRDFGRMLLNIHNDCLYEDCRARLRGLQAIFPGRYECPIPTCPVPDEIVAPTVARFLDACAALQAARESLIGRLPGGAEMMLAATSRYGACRSRRDAMFLRALPDDGTIPAALIARFGLEYLDVHRLLPALVPSSRACR